MMPTIREHAEAVMATERMAKTIGHLAWALHGRLMRHGDGLTANEKVAIYEAISEGWRPKMDDLMPARYKAWLDYAIETQSGPELPS